MRNQLEKEQQKSKEEGLLALQNANEDKRRTVNEFQMRIQDLNNQIQRLESKYQEEILGQKLQLEKEHLVNILLPFTINSFLSLSSFRIKSTN